MASGVARVSDARKIMIFLYPVSLPHGQWRSEVQYARKNTIFVYPVVKSHHGQWRSEGEWCSENNDFRSMPVVNCHHGQWRREATSQDENHQNRSPCRSHEIIFCTSMSKRFAAAERSVVTGEMLLRRQPSQVLEQIDAERLPHDNAHPHATLHTQQLLHRFRWDVFHHPAYSPDLAPSDYHLFQHLKNVPSEAEFPRLRRRADGRPSQAFLLTLEHSPELGAREDLCRLSGYAWKFIQKNKEQHQEKPLDILTIYLQA
ncbi:hypothetical protein AVEN_105961-1 [Araneus ventricosus]|uniref:Mariner Mos1 transposase n=1 Tax=Araneus ventricosus TaxID=182803 RepID=A0A4Y2DVE2_ARAVE|nr:hypothetical protein AVEN_105961-1 [Araneus ventricosus]